MSAYSFMLGTHPEQVEGLGLIREKVDSAPLRDANVDDARRALYLDRAVDKAQPVYIHTGNADGFFFRDIKKLIPGLQKDFEYNLKQASQEFEISVGDELFKRLSLLMNVNTEDLDFENIANFLDDYICAFANGKSTAPFDFDKETLELIGQYYYFLINHGLLRDPSLNKVIAHPFLYSLLREILFKAQDESEIARWEGPCVSSKVSLAFGNRLTYLAVLRVLNLDQNILYSPGWGDQLTFELFTENGQWFVRIFNNNEVVTSIESSGNIKLEDFNYYVCSRLYYGDMDAVKAGYEDYHKMAQIKGSQCKSLTKVVPLFGCTLKKEFNHAQNTRTEYGWTQNELKKNDVFRKFGGRGSVDDSIYFIKAKQSDGYSYSYSYSDGGANSGSSTDNLVVNSGDSYSYSFNSGKGDGNNADQTGQSGQPGQDAYSYSYSYGNQDGNSAQGGYNPVSQPQTPSSSYSSSGKQYYITLYFRKSRKLQFCLSISRICR